jgi:hypothetical protein
MRPAAHRLLNFHQVRLELWKLEAVWDLLVFKPVSDLLLENLQLVLHFRVDVSFSVRHYFAKRCVADFVPVLCVLDLNVSFTLRGSVC